MKRILIVDDSMSVREQFIDILNPLAECQTATNGQEAVNLIKMNQGTGNDFDIVIMDIIMPEKDGLTAIKEIREYETLMGWTGDDKLAIIVATTIKDPTRILIAQQECGANDYIPKPFTRETVLQALKRYGVSNHINQRVAMKENAQFGYAHYNER